MSRKFVSSCVNSWSSSESEGHWDQLFFTILVQVLDPLPDGMGEWVTLYAPKWDYLWVETYRPIDTPVDFKFWYRLHEYGNELQDLPFENGS